MKKVITVHLASEIFQMEEDGYAMIRKVLNKIDDGSAKGQLLGKEIEGRIASLLKEKATNEKLVTSEQVEDVIFNMGYSGYIKDEAWQRNNNYNGSGYKKMYRHTDDKVIGGVCSGMAAYFNTDPVLIRILFLVLLFGAGTGLLLYIIMWIIVPSAPYNH